jgi:hypothetical protein
MTGKSKYYYEFDRNSTSSTINPKMKMSKEELGLEKEHITRTGGLFPTGVRSMDAKPNIRKEKPVFTGVLKYFPDAILEIAKCSYIGQKQHNPNKPLSWDRSKSGDELDALARHLLGAGTLDTDGIKHSAKVAWRALANLQKELENDAKANL